MSFYFEPVPKLLSQPNVVVLDARVGYVESVDEEKDQQRLSIACINGLHIQGDKAENVMDHLVKVAKAVSQGGDGDAIVGYSLMDVQDNISGLYMLPNGDAFFVPKRSACGFLVKSCWVRRVVDVARLKRGLCEITLRISSSHHLRLLYCLKLHGTYPTRRLLERIEELENMNETSGIVVIFGSDDSLDEAEDLLSEECEGFGLHVWTGLLKEETRTFIATKYSSDALDIEDLIVEEILDLPYRKQCYVVRATVGMVSKSELEPAENFRSEPTARAARDIAGQMEKAERRKKEKTKKAERRRQEKERAAQLVGQLEEGEKMTPEISLLPRHDDAIAIAAENLILREVASMASEKQISEMVATKVKKKRNRRRTKKDGVEDGDAVYLPQTRPQKVVMATLCHSGPACSRDNEDISNPEQVSSQDLPTMEMLPFQEVMVRLREHDLFGWRSKHRTFV
ncbi:hypothetical protein Y032_0025g1113 [Ancylostoma ceylanicum]|uniref:Uncharacterized protein n=1 Tax=Ancylostoma ceylanicum TaxID=53326 RepID=A0A016UW73_9BILA|nr:hypothetical protein Y032_0025g1113 [Ancylostoma ceylanicum]